MWHIMADHAPPLTAPGRCLDGGRAPLARARPSPAGPGARVRFFLFCNQGYGVAFEEAFRAWCAGRGVSDYFVVHSLRGLAPASPASSLPGRVALRAALEARVRLPRLTGHTLAVQDVNG